MKFAALLLVSLMCAISNGSSDGTFAGESDGLTGPFEDSREVGIGVHRCPKTKLCCLNSSKCCQGGYGCCISGNKPVTMPALPCGKPKRLEMKPALQQ